MQNPRVKIQWESSQSRIHNFILEEKIGEIAQRQTALPSLRVKKRHELGAKVNHWLDFDQVHKCPIEHSVVLRS